MKHFSKIPIATSERSKQNLSSTTYNSQDFGMLNPIYHVEVCPGDDIDLDVSAFYRMAPMPYPIHGNFRHDVRVFFVPWRILQPQGTGKFVWDDYITGVSNQSLPYTTISLLRDFLFATDIGLTDEMGFAMSLNNTTHGKYKRDAQRLFSLMGLPEYVWNPIWDGSYSRTTKVSLWPFLAYQRIWWDYYRNSELITEQLKDHYFPALMPGNNTIGANVTSNPDYFVHHFLMPRYACFAKDYFTTVKLNPQSGETASSVGSASDLVVSQSNPSAAAQFGILYQNNENRFVEANYVNFVNSAGSSTPGVTNVATNPNNVIGLRSDSSFTIEIFRRANALQKYLERNNIVGSRLIERFLARFGVAPSAEKLQMVEYLGGSSGSYNIGAVMSSSDTFQASGSTLAPSDGFGMNLGQSMAGGSVQGLSTGAGALNLNSGKIKYHAKEFGTLMVISTIVPKIVYTQGLHRSWVRGMQERFEFLTPEFDRLGYEAVARDELVYTGNENGANPFGYVPRYSSYKYKLDVKAGDLVLDGTNSSQDCVTVERKFDSLDESPLLTNDFTVIGPDERYNLDKVFSFPGNAPSNTTYPFDHFIGYAHTECHITRNVSDDGLPALDPDLDDNKKKILVENGGVRF